MPDTRQATLKRLVTDVQRILAAEDFSLSGTMALVRLTEPAYFQVIDFQSDKQVTNRMFTVNVGICDRVSQSLQHSDTSIAQRGAPRTASDALPQIRLSRLMGRRDAWWPIDLEPVSMADYLSTFALPFLARLRSRQTLIAEWEQGTLDVLGPWSVAPAAAIIGRKELARAVAAKLVEESSGGPAHDGARALAARIEEYPGPAAG